MSHDPLSDLLKLADFQSLVTGAFCASGAWAIHFPPPDKIKFFAAHRGGSWFRLDGEADVVRMEQGDVIVLALRRGFVLASEPDVPPVEASSLFAGRTDSIVRVGGVDPDGAETFQLGGHVQLHPSQSALLFDVLPPVIHVHGSAPEAVALRWILDQLALEREGRPGSSLATSQLAHLLFIQVLRVHLASGAPLRSGWLRAVVDERIAPALKLMHDAPGHPWRLEQLARAAAMSRTSFATYFKSVAGEAPLTYLARWRMRLAEQALRREDVPLATLADTLGYASESAFSHAFKRIVGVSPRHYGANFRQQESSAA